jgi:hypothetical protein
MYYKLSNILGLLALFAFTACREDPPLVELPKPVSAGHTVFVLNEGNFQSGNASVSAINLTNDAVAADMFHAANQRPIGDVLQSAALVNGEGWLVVNNSQKIERVNLNTMKAAAPITGFHSPRYVLEVSPTKAYVTDLYANRIHIVNTVSGNITGHISCTGWTERLIRVGDEIWVTNVRRNKIYVIDPLLDLIRDSVAVGDDPSALVLDANQHVWVLCNGKIPPNETAGSLWKIDPVTKSLLAHFSFPLNAYHPSNLKLDPSKSSLYFIFNGVYKMSANDTSLPASALIPLNNKMFYGLDIRAEDGSIWVSDAKDYVQKGVVYTYSETGQLRKSYSVGYIPASFYFY